MRALLSTIGSRGDVQPLVALAVELRRRGHDALLCVPPDFRGWIERLGITVAPIGPEVTPAVRSPAPPSGPTVDRRRQMAEATVATQFDTIGAAARGCDVIVAATALQVAARSVAERLGLPYVFAAYTPSVLPSRHHAPPVLPPLPGQQPLPADADNRERWDRDGERFNDLFGPALNQHRTSWGLEPVSDVRRHMFTDRPWLAADPILGPWPSDDELRVVQTGAWLLHDDRALPPDVETFLDTGAPPIYFGFGSLRPPQDNAEVQTRLDAARALGHRAIFSRGWFELLGPEAAPDYCVVGDTNLFALFRRVAAVVHHGGAGTTVLAALAGIPQVVIPTIYDQYYWADRIAQLSVGVAQTTAPTPESLTVAMQRAVDSGVGARAREIARHVRTDGVELAAERLIEGAYV